MSHGHRRNLITVMAMIPIMRSTDPKVIYHWLYFIYRAYDHPADHRSEDEYEQVSDNRNDRSGGRCPAPRSAVLLHAYP